MPIVQAGKTFTKDDLKQTAGNLASMIRDHVQSGLDFKTQLESWPDADLVALGLAQDEINAIKGFYVGDLPAIANLLSASSWIKQLLGTGV
jgi:hypothetical protein